MVQELLARAKAQATIPIKTKSVRIEGLAWETDDGNRAGTSALGLAVDRQLKQAFEARRVGVSTEPSLGSKGIVGSILKGSYRVLQSGVRMSLSLVDAQTGHVLSETRRMLSPSTFANIAQDQILPPDAGNAQLLAQLVGQTLGGQASAFGLRVSTDRGDQAAYFEGDQLHAVVQVDRDCYLRLYHISWSQRALTLIFPNRSETNSFVPAGTLRRIPDDASGAEFEVAKPYGVDAIIAIASTQPFPDDAQVIARLTGTPAETPMLVNAIPAGQPMTYPSRSAADSAATQSNVTVAGQYLTQQNMTEQQTRGVLARGLIVREHAAGSGMPITVGGAAPGSAAYQQPLQQTYPQSQGSASGLTQPGMSGAMPPQELARAACFFTTLPSIRVGR